MEENKNEQEGFKVIDTTEKAEVAIEEEPVNKPKPKSLFKELISYVLIIAIAYSLATLIHKYVFTPVSVDGESMKPTLYHDDLVLLWRLGEYEHNDVVVFESPSGDYYIKRLIGLPGDHVRYENDQLFINNEPIEEPFLEEGKRTIPYNGTFTPDFTLENLCGISEVNCNINGEVQIPEGYFLVLGDNRPHSYDSEDLGLFSEDKLIGKAEFVLYPFKRIGKL